MKTCRKCGEAKPVEEFNRNKRYPDGRDHRCKPCHRQVSTDWQRGIGKAAHAAAVKTWRQKNPGAVLASDRRTRDRHPLHWRARRAVRQAVIDGRLVRPDACPDCGKSRRLQAHHWRGYEPAAWLDVQWLCSGCHAAAHRVTEIR